MLHTCSAFCDDASSGGAPSSRRTLSAPRAAQIGHGKAGAAPTFRAQHAGFRPNVQVVRDASKGATSKNRMKKGPAQVAQAVQAFRANFSLRALVTPTAWLVATRTHTHTHKD